MKVSAFKSLDVRLALIVAVILLTFSVVAGFFTYNYSYQRYLGLADEQQKQIVRTVQAQAEVAVYASNEAIARGVLEGLLATPSILAARIESTDIFKIELGSRSKINFGAGKTYPLFSPVNHLEAIGVLVIVSNADWVGGEAKEAAIFQTMLMLLEILIAVLIVAIVLRIMVLNPIFRLSEGMVTIQPGSSLRLDVEEKHKMDQIGLLSNRINATLDSAEVAINEAKAQRNELERLSTHDYLTGLPTMRLAEDRLRVACLNATRSKEKVALLFIDLDGFKSVNDTYGHELGDETLKEVAKRLRENLRAEDTAARIGGDEFIVILAKLPDAEASELVAKKINMALSLPFEISGHSLLLGGSIGIAIFPDHTSDAGMLRHLADSAMYKVKKSEKGGYLFGEYESKLIA